MSGPGRRRTLAELVDAEAPLPPTRAAAVMTAVVRALAAGPAHGEQVTDLMAESVILSEDGSATVTSGAAPDGVAAGAGVGRLLFQLLVGRRPFATDDAFEPHVTNSFPPSTVALLSRSFSDSPGQWPAVADWAAELSRIAGAHAPAEPPRVVAARRRRQVLIALALALLVLISVTVVLLAPGWWDAATDEEGRSGPAAQDLAMS